MYTSLVNLDYASSATVGKHHSPPELAAAFLFLGGGP